ncbi:MULTISPECIES: hypothetical protein [Neobacillus]|uniref:hypothetical protein n=1 Tax=Neobacillus TaxID=2675232 RepID=UPI002E249F72|nr:hypothetical protein [Neobacillus thermocopriae]MED3713395.1 hypothetical protein [Neobacillus thermocopriae]
MATKISPYIFLFISLILFGLIQANISFGNFGPIVVIAMIVCPIIALVLGMKNSGKGKWFSIIISAVVFLTVSLLGIIGAGFLNEF